MSPGQNALYFSHRAKCEAREAREARLRGADQMTVALHSERAVRFQAMALRLSRNEGASAIR